LHKYSTKTTMKGNFQRFLPFLWYIYDHIESDQ